MLTTCSVVSISSAAVMVFGAGIASGQTYPNKPIRILTVEPGGGVDLAARLIAPGLTASLGQPVIIDNRASLMGIDAVAKAQPDGYNLLFNGSVVWLTQFMRDNVSWDPVKDLSPITLATRSPYILVVHPSLPVKSVKELIALAKARPGTINYGLGAIGGPPQLAAELFKAMAGLNIVGIPYKSGGQAVNAVVGGEVKVMFPSAPSVAQHVRSGSLRALAVTSAQPSVLAPDLPTVADSGLPGYEIVGLFGIFAPANTPVTIVKRLNQEIVRALNIAEVKKRLLNDGIETVGSSPEQLTMAVKADMARLGKVIKDAGIRSN